MLATAVLLAGIPIHAQDVVAQWSFPDQGFGGTADVSATTLGPGATASGITPGAGYVNQVTQLNGGGSYIDASGNAQTDDDPPLGLTTPAATTEAYYYVGDWGDGTADGGSFLPDGITNQQMARPAGPGPAGAGALFVSSPGELRNEGIAQTIENELFLTFTITAETSDLTIEAFTFHASQGSSAARRAWESWYLQVDTGGGFTTLAEVAGTIPDNQTWALQTATFSPLNLSVGETATFRLGGLSSEASQFGRGTALDDLTLLSSLPPEAPAPFALTIRPAAAPTTGFELQWTSQEGKLYTLLASEDLAAPISDWDVVTGGDILPATPPSNTFNVDPIDARRFYAVEEFDAP